MKGVYNESDIPLLKDRSIFFDANILIYIYFTIDPNDWKQINYSRVFKKLVEANFKLVFDVMVISEVINRALRMEYEMHLNKEGIIAKNFSFKDFRNSEIGVEAWRKVRLMLCEVIFPRFSLAEKKWSKDEVEKLLDTIGDFNDLMIAKICREENYILLTHDADFVEADLEVLSLNSRFFERSN